jgi:hypothetical protein
VYSSQCIDLCAYKDEATRQLTACVHVCIYLDVCVCVCRCLFVREVGT